MKETTLNHKSSLNMSLVLEKEVKGMDVGVRRRRGMRGGGSGGGVCGQGDY